VFDAPPNPLAPSLTDEQTGLGEDLGVVRDGRLAALEWLFEGATTGLALSGHD
jgi:hypothetical protein